MVIFTGLFGLLFNAGGFVPTIADGGAGALADGLLAATVDINTGKIIKMTNNINIKNIHKIIYSPDGKYLIVAGDDTFYIYETIQLNLIQTIYTNYNLDLVQETIICLPNLINY